MLVMQDQIKDKLEEINPSKSQITSVDPVMDIDSVGNGE